MQRGRNMSDLNLVYYKDIESRRVNWLWYPYIPYGKITIVQGDPGEGKTTFVLSLLSILSTGGMLPDSDIHISGNAIYQNSEDDNADTIKPRLEKHGADCSKICFINKYDTVGYPRIMTRSSHRLSFSRSIINSLSETIRTGICGIFTPTKVYPGHH